MAVRVVLKGESISVQTRRNMATNLSDMARATTNGAKEAAQQILTRGRQDIGSAGRFGPRWIEGLKADVQPKSGALINAKITITHDIEYFDVFETGGVIRGRPLLWIPLSYTGLKISAGTYARVFGGLFTVRRASGPPLLFSAVDKKPKYFGISQVTIPKKFHIAEICQNVMAGFDAIYTRNMPAKK